MNIHLLAPFVLECYHWREFDSFKWMSFKQFMKVLCCVTSNCLGQEYLICLEMEQIKNEHFLRALKSVLGNEHKWQWGCLC